MVRIVIDEELRRKLNGLREPVELVDEAGKRLGLINGDSSIVRDRNWEPTIGPEHRPPFNGQEIYSSEEVRKALS